MSEDVSRGYRYALILTPAQEAAVQRQEVQLRRAWNKMVNWHRCALRDWTFGRRTQMLAEFREILDSKMLTGQASVKAVERATKEQITKEVAVGLNRAAAVARKEKYGPRRMGVELAQERLMAKAEHFYGGQKSLLYGLVQKFQKSCENWLKLAGTAQAPRYKRDQDNVALQRQILKGRSVIGHETDLSGFIGQSGTRCHVVFHRPLPDKAVIKQLAITGRAGKRFLVVFFSCPLVSVMKPFGKSTSQAGIDTGYQCALTVVSNDYTENKKARREALAIDMTLNSKLTDDPQSEDGRALAGALGNLEHYIFKRNQGVLQLQPPVARDSAYLKRHRRLQRRMDRQKRAANPECFNPDGTWKKGKRAKNVTNNLVETHRRMQHIDERVANVRRDYYHVTAFNLLKKHGHIIVGEWQPPVLKKGKNPAEKGLAKKRRNMNRKGLDHALSSFKTILQDKAKLSASPRTVDIVNEAMTTRTCGCCHKETGPEGPTYIAKWTCSGCGAENFRKANAAENMISVVLPPERREAHPVAVPA